LISVARLWRYPVKSLRGEACQQLRVGPRGAQGDRLFSVQDSDGKLGSGKNSRRTRRIEGLLGLQGSGMDEDTAIQFPDGSRRTVADPLMDAALSAALGLPVRLAREAGTPHFDAAPLHLVTTAGLAWLRRALPQSEIDERRFRPNLVLDATGEGMVEQDWIGRRLRVGESLALRIVQPTERCVMVTMAQAGLGDDARILRTLAERVEACFGVYAEVEAPGEARVGDTVRLEA
jgi:uncharacterized protein YcbX